MGTDFGTREDIARQAIAQSYVDFTRNLLFIPTVQEIREAVRTTPGLDSELLGDAIARLGDEYRGQGRSAAAELVDYVKVVVEPFLPKPEPAAPPVTDGKSLLAALLRESNPLRARTMLLRYRDLVTLDVYHAAELKVGDLGRSEPPKELIAAIYLMGRIVGGTRERAMGLLLWGAYCRTRRWQGHAERHLKRAAVLARDVDDSTIRLMILGAQAGLYRAEHRHAEAAAVLEESLRVAGEGDENELISVSLADGLAGCYRALGQPTKALAAASRLVTLSEGIPGRKSKALNFRGLLYEDIGRYDLGGLDYEAAIEVATAEGDRPQQFTAMNNRAASFLKRGMAREGYRAFQAILRQAGDWGNTRMLASTHNNLGQALCHMGNYGEARAEFGKALRAKINSDDSYGELIAMQGMSRCNEQLGDPEGAKAFCDLAMVPALERGDASLIAQVVLPRPGDSEKPDELERTLESLRWARDLARKQSYPLQEGLLVARIANHLEKAGRTDEALAECRSFLESTTSEMELGAALILLVQYARLLGARDETWQKGFHILMERLHAAEIRIEESVVDTRRAEIISETRSVYGALLQLLASPSAQLDGGQSPAAFAFDLHESAKSRSLLASLADAASLTAPPRLPAELRERESALLSAERNWQEQAVSSEGYRYENLGQIRRGLKECWEEMRPIAPAYVRMRSGEPYTFSEISELLRAGKSPRLALVSFFADQEATTCFVVQPESTQPRMLSIPVGRQDLEVIARKLRRTFNGAPDEFPPYPPVSGDRLFRRKLDFLEPLNTALQELFACLEGAELVCVAPHGPLHLIPLNMLQLPGGKYFGEEYGVVYSPSLSTAVQTLSRGTGPAAGGKTRVFTAGVSSADDAHPEYFEGDTVLFSPVHWEVRSAIGLRDASREAVLSGLPGSRVIHISCHAFFDGGNALNSGLVLSNGRSKAPRDLSQLSFLKRQEYLITVRDLMRMSLDAELVTLSACSTGFQYERNGGDELEGFSRALLSAGAGAALLTMWNVDQASSQQLLAAFYRNWSELGLPKWRAFHLAQQDFIRSESNLRHPYHWAPFTLIGTWR
jgi:tetratricopeptide (TPR) repeat protein